MATLALGACGSDTITAPATAPEVPVPITSDITPPVKTTHVQPFYPADARQRRVQGIVSLEVVVSRTGRVTDVKVIDSPDLALSEASVVAVKQWAYEPATRNGQPIAVIMTVTVRFVLQ